MNTRIRLGIHFYARSSGTCFENGSRNEFAGKVGLEPKLCIASIVVV